MRCPKCQMNWSVLGCGLCGLCIACYPIIRDFDLRVASIKADDQATAAAIHECRYQPVVLTPEEIAQRNIQG